MLCPVSIYDRFRSGMQTKQEPIDGSTSLDDTSLITVCSCLFCNQTRRFYQGKSRLYKHYTWQDVP